MEKVKKKQYLFKLSTKKYFQNLKKMSKLAYTNTKFEMPDNFMKVKVRFLRKKTLIFINLLVK